MSVVETIRLWKHGLALLRNIEAGVLVSDVAFARATAIQFDRLIDRGYLLPLAKPGSGG